jgi:predicted DNA binding CopG/RHH family protein
VIKNNFRVTSNRNEILKNLSTKFTEVGSFLLWQKFENSEKRTISTNVKFDTLNIKYNFFTVRIENQDIEKIKKDTDTFFLLKDYNFVFKTRLISISPSDPNIFQFKLPKDIHLKELRKDPRREIEQNEKINIEVIFEDKIDGKKLNAVCPILNISNGGVSILLTSETMKRIKIDEKVMLCPQTSLPELRHPTLAIIRNVRVFSKKTFIKGEVFAIGLEFILDEGESIQK